MHIATEGPLGWSALRAARSLNLPVVSDFRTNFHAYSRHYGVGWPGAPLTTCLRHFHYRCASTMVPAEALRSEPSAAGFERLRVVARGVDIRAFHPSRRSPALRASRGAGPDEKVAPYVGRLAAGKNLGLLLDAVASMRREDPLIRLVGVGDGPEREHLARRCPWAHFTGLRRADDLAAHCASAGRRGRLGDIIKVLRFDGQRLMPLSRRLERARFVGTQGTSGSVSLTAAQLSMLLLGIDWRMPVRTHEDGHRTERRPALAA